MVDRTPPANKLLLEHVYGYHGHQCRNNLYYTATNDIVYFIAGVGVVFNTKDHLQRFYYGHDDDIISLALHHEGKFVATGQVGDQPYICVWNVSNCETLSILKDNHRTGIGCLAFNVAGNLIVSVGLEEKPQVSVWDWKKGKVLATMQGHTERIFDVSFNPYVDNQFASCGVKHMKFWTLCGNAINGKKGVFGKLGEVQSVLCLTYGPGEVVYSGTLCGDIYKWSDNQLVDNIRGAHRGGVFTIQFSADGFVSGSKDGTVALWNDEFKPITRIDLTQHAIGYAGISVRSVCWNEERLLIGTNNGEILEVTVADKDKPVTLVQGHAEGQLWGLAVHPRKHVFATGSDDRTVRLWDMSNKVLLAKTAFDAKARSMAFSSEGTHLTVGFADGSFRVLKSRSLEELLHIQDRQDVLHVVSYSSNGTYLAAGGNEGFVDVYSVHDSYKRITECKGNSSYISHMDWSEDGHSLQVNTGAGERLFFQIPGGKQISSKEEIETIHWQSWTCILGSEVNGIWEKYKDTTDINTTDTNFQRGIVATGDDFGKVKLLRFPCVKKGAKARVYTGHSDHVTSVRFSADGNYLISLGGADHAVFQWKVLSDGYKGDGMQDDSGSDATDSDLSDVNAVDSDLEQEVSKVYDRDLYKEDMAKIQQEVKLSMGSENKKARPPAPTKSVKLQHVFGYRGYDCRNNLFYSQSNEIVYHIAAVGVVFDVQANKQRFYLGHDDDIMCLTLHPIKDLVATGQVGRDPSIHVWNADNLATLSILKGQHKRGVSALDFSADGKKLVSIGLDDDHSMVVWDWRRGEKLSNTRVHKDKIFEVRWDSNDSMKLVTVGVRHMKFWTQAGGGLTAKRGNYGKVGKADTMLCVTYPKAPGLVVSGGLSGLIFVWNGEILKKTVKAHEGAVFAIHSLEKGFVSGGKDGKVCLWDEMLDRCLKSYNITQANVSSHQHKDIIFADFPPIRAVTLGQGKILVGTKHGEILEIDKSGPVISLVQGHGEGEVWGLAHHPSKDICVTMSDDKCLRVWDLTDKQLLKMKRFTVAGRCLEFSPDASVIAVGFNDGSFAVVKAANLTEVCRFQHRKEEIADLKFSPGEGKYLAVASHDNFIDLYNVMTQKRVGICKGASSYITHVDWNTAGKLIQVNTGAKEVLYFEAPRGKRQAVTKTELENLKWSTWTCVLGKSCVGIWPLKSDVTDVNASHLTKDGKLLATGDDFGFLKLFAFPSNGKDARCKKFNAHSAHVTNVRWTHDNQMLASVGGADTSLMLWSLEDGDGDDETDSEEESGYDSDVEREKNIDYASKIYMNLMRKSDAVKPQDRKEQSAEKNRFDRGQPTKSVVQRKSGSKDSKKPREITDLSLDFVIGYRGYDTRNNLHYTSDGSIVYPAAGTCIQYDVHKNTQTFYTQHTDDVICMTLNRNPKFQDVVATGQIGVNPLVHVWEVTSKKTLSTLQGFHKKGVCSVNFSSSGRYLVTVGIDDEHSLAVWRWNDGHKVANGAGHSKRIFVAEFRPDSDSSFVTCGVKHVCWWNITGGSLVAKKGNLSSCGGTRMQTMLSVAYGPNNVTFTGAMTGDVFIWSSNLLTRVVENVLSGPVFCMFTTVKDGLIVTGGKEKGCDGCALKLWDHEMKRCKSFKVKKTVRSVCRVKGNIIVGTQSNEIYEVNEKTGNVQLLMQGHCWGELWGLATHPSKNVFATASDDKTLRTWDLNSKSLLSLVDCATAAKCCSISPKDSLVAVGLKNGEFQIRDATTLKIVQQKRDKNKGVTEIRFSPDGSSLAVATEDNSLDFYSTKPQLKRFGYCKNLSSTVLQMDFSADGAHVQVCTGAYERQVIKVSDGSQITDASKIDGIVWDTWTCTLGDKVKGIWPKHSDKGDINSTNLSHSGRSLATGDDFGYVKLFPFPVDAPGKRYAGHSAHVTNVRFSHNDEYLISIGGDDSCIFVWKCS